MIARYHGSQIPGLQNTTASYAMIADYMLTQINSVSGAQNNWQHLVKR